MKRFFMATFFLVVLCINGSISGINTKHLNFKKTIKIGVVGPLTGLNNFSGIAQLNGVRLAVEEVNKTGGINGAEIEILSADDQGMPDLSVRGVKKMISKGAVAILGAINSSCTLADMKVCSLHHIPILTSTSTATKITAIRNEWIFRCIESDFFRMAAISEYLIEELKLKNIGILYENDDYGIGLKKDLSRNLVRYGISIKFAHVFKRGQIDFHPLLEQAYKKGVRALGLFGVTSDNVRIAAQAYKSGLEFQLFSPDVNQKYIAEDVRGVEGLIATDSFYLLLYKKRVINFISKFRARFGSVPGPIEGRAYDATRILLQALEKTKGKGGKVLRDAIFATENFPGVTGDFNFKSNGDVIKKIHIIAIHDGHFVPAKEWKVQRGYWRTFGIYAIVFAIALIIVFFLGNGAVRLILRKKEELEFRKFRPVKVNPYIVGNPVRKKEMFFGREDDFKFIEENLRRVGSGVCIVLCGDRRSGKTSILYQILNGHLGQGYLPALVDLQLYGNLGNGENFFNRMNQDILQQIPYLNADKNNLFGREGFERLIHLIVERNSNKKLLLLLDEYEIIETLIAHGMLHPSIVAFLSGLLERYPSLSYVLTGSTPLEKRQKEYWHHLISKSIYRKISFLTKKDTMRLIKEPLKGIVVYDVQVPEKIFRLSWGQPFYTQAICMNIVDHLNEKMKNRVSLKDLEDVIEQLVENPLPQMLYFWDNFSANEKTTLSLLADAMGNDGEHALSGTDLGKWVVKKGLPLNISTDFFSTTLESLYIREIIIKENEKFKFRMDLFRIWIQRDHSPWQIIGEMKEKEK